MARQQKLMGWIVTSTADVGARLVIQLATTVIFTRLLAPDVFGQAALVMAYTALLSLIATAAFDEVLVRQPRLRSAHVGVAYLLTAGAAVLLVALAWLLSPHVMGAQSSTAQLLPIYSLMLLLDVPLMVHTALARRQKAFHRLAVSNFAGLLVGSLCGVALVLAEHNVWALLIIQPVSRVVQLLTLLRGSRVRIRPQWSRAALAELAGFAKWHGSGRLVDSVSEVAFQTIVQRLFGLDGNGYLNMAMRIVEPIRGAVGSVGHAIAMSIFSRMQQGSARFSASVERSVAESALVLLPVFAGLAAIAPTLISTIAGPTWQPAHAIAQLLALAAALTVVSNLLHSAISARGRADIGFLSTVQDLLVTCALLYALAGEGLMAIGLARLLAYALDLLVVLWQAQRTCEVDARRLLAATAGPALSAAVMAAAVWSTPQLGLTPTALLAVQIVAGGALYTALVAMFHRDAAATLIGRFSGRLQ